LTGNSDGVVVAARVVIFDKKNMLRRLETEEMRFLVIFWRKPIFIDRFFGERRGAGHWF
jgi:hypothetical protein